MKIKPEHQPTSNSRPEIKARQEIRAFPLNLEQLPYNPFNPAVDPHPWDQEDINAEKQKTHQYGPFVALQ
jgi:hypothetical protein